MGSVRFPGPNEIKLQLAIQKKQHIYIYILVLYIDFSSIPRHFSRVWKVSGALGWFLLPGGSESLRTRHAVGIRANWCWKSTQNTGIMPMHLQLIDFGDLISS